MSGKCDRFNCQCIWDQEKERCTSFRKDEVSMGIRVRINASIEQLESIGIDSVYAKFFIENDSLMYDEDRYNGFATSSRVIANYPIGDKLYETELLIPTKWLTKL
jgi:hypothetical protein